MKHHLSFPGIYLVFLFVSLISDAQIKAVNGSTIPVPALEKFLKMEMDSLGMPALSIAIINNDRIIYHRALGVTGINTKKAVDDESIFEAASMSKPAFAYLVMKDVDKGLLSLDTPLYKYMAYPDIEQDERYKLITARMVLSHTTGFPNWRFNEKGDSVRHIPPGNLYLKFTPGTQFSYSGEGYQYLAKVIAFLNHRDLHSLDMLYQEEVSKQLGLKHFYFTANEYIYRHKVDGHYQGKDVGRPWPGNDTAMFNAAASLHVEAVDYARFVIALMEHRGISKAGLNEMLKAQVEMPRDNELYTYAGDTAWGLGLAIKPTKYGISYEHGGNNGDFQSAFQYFPAQREGYVFLTNCDKGNEFNLRLSRFLMNGE